MLKAYERYWKNYFNFKGRSSRSDYWFASLADCIIYLLFFLIMFIAPKTAMVSYYIYILATIIPNISITVRRFHDIGKSFVYILFGLIPIVGRIIVLVWLASGGENGTNQYGDDPKISC